MEDNSAKRTNDETEEVSDWVNGAKKVTSICEIDFLGLLPHCAVYRILQYLDVKTLLTACQVTKRWDSIISKNQGLWRNVCSRNGFLVPAEPSPEQLADATYSKRLCLKNTALVQRLIKGETISLKGHTALVCAMFYYKGKLAAALDTDVDSVRIWSCSTGECLANYSMRSDCICDIKFDDNFIVTGDDCSAVCWDVSNGTKLQTFDHEYPVWSVDFNTIIDVLVTGSYYCVNIWSFTDANLLRTLEFEIENVNPIYEVPPDRVKIWGTHDCFFHILACNEHAVIDYEIGLNMTVVDKKDVFIKEGNLLFSGYHVDDSSLKVWVEERVCLDGMTSVTETNFECVNSCGRSSLTRRPITRIVGLPYTAKPVNYLTGGDCFDVFVVRDGDSDDDDDDNVTGRLYVTWHNSETKHFTIDLPESVWQSHCFKLCACETQWLDGISEEFLCDRALVAAATEQSGIELLKLKMLK